MWNLDFEKSQMSVLFGSSRPQMLFKVVVLKNFTIFTGKHLYWNLYFHKVTFPVMDVSFKKKKDLSASTLPTVTTHSILRFVHVFVKNLASDMLPQSGFYG